MIKPERHSFIDLLLLLFFLAFFALFNWSYGSVAVLLLAFLIMLCWAAGHEWYVSFRLSFFHVWLIVLCVFCYLSSLWAWDVPNARTKGTTVLSIFVCFSMVYVCVQEYDAVSSLFKAVMWAGNILMLYTVAFYGISYVVFMLREGERLPEEFFLNSNVLGVLFALAIVVSFYFVLKDGKLRISSLFIPLGIVLVSLCGSRQALGLMAGGVVLLFVLFVMQGKSPGEKAVIVLAGILLAAGFLFAFSTLPAFSGIYDRLTKMLSAFTGVGEADRSSTIRLQLISVGLAQLQKTPLFGIGMGSGHLVAEKYLAKTFYLHNNYVEILTGGGISGFVIYYSIYVWLFASYIRFRKVSTSETVMCTVLLVMLLVEDFANVTYYNKDTYFYLMLCSLEAEKLKRLFYGERRTAGAGFSNCAVLSR